VTIIGRENDEIILPQCPIGITSLRGTVSGELKLRFSAKSVPRERPASAVDALLMLLNFRKSRSIKGAEQSGQSVTDEQATRSTTRSKDLKKEAKIIKISQRSKRKRSKKTENGHFWVEIFQQFS